MTEPSSAAGSVPNRHLVRVKDAATALGLSKATVSEQVKAFVRQGWLTKDDAGRFDLDLYRRLRAGGAINPMKARHRGAGLGYEPTLDEIDATLASAIEASSPALDAMPADRWPDGRQVLAVLRAHGAPLLAARLDLAGLPPATVALACAHLAELIGSLIAGADAEPWGDALNDGTFPPAGAPQLAGVDYPAIVRQVAEPADEGAADELLNREVGAFAEAFSKSERRTL